MIVIGITDQVPLLYLFFTSEGMAFLMEKVYGEMDNEVKDV